MVVNFICKCYWLLGSQLSISSQYVTIAIINVGSRSGCSNLRERRRGGNDLDRRRVNIVVDNKELLRETNKQTRVRL